MARFKLEPSAEKEGWWVLTDTENLVVLRFEEHKFNGTQTVSVLDEEDFMSLPGSPAVRMATVMREMGEWLFRCHYSIAMPTPVYEWREHEESGTVYLLRNKYPKLAVRINEDDTDIQAIADALKKAAEFVLKGGHIR